MDANVIKRIITGILAPTTEQYLAADLDGNGILNAIDANNLTRLMTGAVTP